MLIDFSVNSNYRILYLFFGEKLDKWIKPSAINNEESVNKISFV